MSEEAEVPDSGGLVDVKIRDVLMTVHQCKDLSHDLVYHPDCQVIPIYESQCCVI